MFENNALSLQVIYICHSVVHSSAIFSFTVFYNFEVMASRMQRLDVDLAKCYENDLDWNLLPGKLREVSL